MAWNDYKDGWGVVDVTGLIVRSVSDTRRATVVNWLCTERGMLATNKATDEQIERMWEANCGDAMVRPVRIYVQ